MWDCTFNSHTTVRLCREAIDSYYRPVCSLLFILMHYESTEPVDSRPPAKAGQSILSLSLLPSYGCRGPKADGCFVASQPDGQNAQTANVLQSPRQTLCAIWTLKLLSCGVSAFQTEYRHLDNTPSSPYQEAFALIGSHLEDSE